MSGRLTILPKKTYCPWNPENVERVLRDERLERERLEREEKANRQSQRERLEDTDGGHVNLFPEAKEAELKLARGQGQKPAATNAGILPVPLGGAPAATPFYMRPQNTSEKYDDDAGLRALGRGGAAAATADEITSKIMRDQYETREDSRKDKMDPMSRFVAGSAPSNGARKQANIEDGRGIHRDAERNKFKEKKCGRHRKRSRRLEESDASSADSTISSASSKRRSRKSTKRRSRSRDEAEKSSRRHRKQRKRKRKHSRRRRSPSPENNQTDLEELRRRRQAREAREMERERRLLDPGGQGMAAQMPRYTILH